MPLPKRKHSLNSSSENEPLAKRHKNLLGSPTFSSTPNPAPTGSSSSSLSTPISKLQKKTFSRLTTVGSSSCTPISSAGDTSSPNLLKSILKSENGKRNSTRSGTSSGELTPIRSVSFEPVPDVVEITLEKMKSQSVSAEELRDLLGCILLNKGTGLILGLERLRENLDNLNNNHTGLIEEISKLPWASHETEVSKAFQQFFICLLSHHPFYCKTVIRSLLKQLVQEDGENFVTLPSQSQRNVNRFVKVFLRNFPRERKELLKQIQNNFPFYKQPSNRFSCYVEGVLSLHKYMCDAGPDILEIIIENIIKLDASIPRDLLVKYNNSSRSKMKKEKVGGSEDEEAESSTSAGEHALDDSSDSDDNDEESVNLSDADKIQCYKIDESMQVLFNFVRDKCFLKQETEHAEKDYEKSEDGNGIVEANRKDQVEILSNENADPLIKVLLNLFTSHILTSDKLQSVQFILFFLVNQSKIYIKEFLTINWEVFKSINNASIIRQAAISHLSGFLCRSQQVGSKTLMKRLKQIISWIQEYMARDSSSKCDYMVVNLASHGPFYSACQAAFYIIAFRHKDLVEEDDVSYLRSLQLNSIISHPLNPLRVVAPSVVNHFSKVVTYYQIAYCNNILQRNQRITLPVLGLSSTSGCSPQAKPLLLDDHFPYQPYLLPKTRFLVDPFYRQFEKLKDYVSETSSDEDEVGEEKDVSSDIQESDKMSGRSGSRSRSLSVSSRRSRTISVTEMISKELDII